MKNMIYKYLKLSKYKGMVQGVVASSKGSNKDYEARAAKYFQQQEELYQRRVEADNINASNQQDQYERQKAEYDRQKTAYDI